jgi:MFS family permease
MGGRRAALGAVLAAGLLGELAYGLLLFPLLQRYLVFDRHLGAAFPGYVLSVYGITRLATQVPLGGIAEATNRRIAVVIGYLAVLAGGLLFWAPGPAAMVLVAAALFGAGHALADPLLPTALAAGVGVHERGRMMAYFNLMQVSGLVVGLVGGAFITDLAPAAAGFLAAACANFGALLLVGLGVGPLLRRDRSAEAARRGRIARPSMWRALTDERAIDLFIVLFLLSLAMNVVMPNVNLYSVQRLGEPLHAVIPYLIPAAALGVTALLFAGWLTDRAGRLLPLLLGAMLATIGFTQLALTRSLAGVAVGATFGATGLALTMPSSNAALIDVAGPAHRALLLSGMMAVQGLGQAVGPLLGGVLAQAAGSQSAFGIGAVALWLVVPATVLFASAPHDGEPGQVVGYTPLTRLISRLNIRAHAYREERRAAAMSARRDRDDG